MYLLDTNVISELRKAGTSRMDPNVRDWAKSVSTSTLYLSAISILELEIGILLLERRDRSQGAVLRAWMEGHVLTTFEGRILAVDTSVARRCATLHVPAPRFDRDALIAATAMVHGMSVVTRNVLHFEPTGVGVVDPWNS
jgi:hypothetical protein